MTIDAILQSGVAGGVHGRQAIERERRGVGKDQAIPDEKHPSLAERDLAVVFADQARALRDQQIPSELGVVDRLGDGREHDARQVRVDAGDERCRDHGARHHLIGRDGRLDRVLTDHASIAAATERTSFERTVADGRDARSRALGCATGSAAVSRQALAQPAFAVLPSDCSNERRAAPWRHPRLRARAPLAPRDAASVRGRGDARPGSGCFLARRGTSPCPSRREAVCRGSELAGSAGLGGSKLGVVGRQPIDPFGARDTIDVVQLGTHVSKAQAGPQRPDCHAQHEAHHRHDCADEHAAIEPGDGPRARAKRQRVGIGLRAHDPPFGPTSLRPMRTTCALSPPRRSSAAPKSRSTM